MPVFPMFEVTSVNATAVRSFQLRMLGRQLLSAPRYKRGNRSKRIAQFEHVRFLARGPRLLLIPLIEKGTHVPMEKPTFCTCLVG